MKELTIEEKAKRFDEALAMAKECITYIPDDAVNKYMLNMFPELKESEDEKIRGAIIDHLKDNNLTEWAAWLEKQGKQKPPIEMITPEESIGIDSEIYNKIVDECVYGEQKPAWTEVDEEMFDAIIADIQFTQKAHNHEVNQVVYEREIDWLKSLKDRVKPKWKPSEEELNALDEVYKTHGANSACRRVIYKLLVQLKKL